eukprot:3539660-Ditylum_brightwellii.AAC.1
MQYSRLKDGSQTPPSSKQRGKQTDSSISPHRSKKKSMGGRRKSAASSELSEPLTGRSKTKINGSEGDDQQWDENGTNGDIEMGSSHSAQNGDAAMDDDPFYVFREDLLRTLKSMDSALNQYLAVVRDTVRTMESYKFCTAMRARHVPFFCYPSDSHHICRVRPILLPPSYQDTAANAHELKDSKRFLKRQIKNAESTLKDLQTTVRLVESRRDKFTHINDAELEDRRTFVQASHGRIASARSEMNSDEVKAKVTSDERAMANRRAGGNSEAFEAEDPAFDENSHAQARMMLQQQDETLDELDDAVERVGAMAGEIHEEIGQQSKMLSELEEDLVTAEEELGMVMGKLAKLLKTKNKWHLLTIIGLSLTVIVLFFLVIYS